MLFVFQREGVLQEKSYLGVNVSRRGIQNIFLKGDCLKRSGGFLEVGLEPSEKQKRTMYQSLFSVCVMVVTYSHAFSLFFLI